MVEWLADASDGVNRVGFASRGTGKIRSGWRVSYWVDYKVLIAKRPDRLIDDWRDPLHKRA